MITSESTIITIEPSSFEEQERIIKEFGFNGLDEYVLTEDEVLELINKGFLSKDDIDLNETIDEFILKLPFVRNDILDRVKNKIGADNYNDLLDAYIIGVDYIYDYCKHREKIGKPIDDIETLKFFMDTLERNHIAGISFDMSLKEIKEEEIKNAK